MNQRRKWVGHCLSWEPKHNFGRLVPTPWKKEFTCWAGSEDEASVLLHLQAKQLGYALGGVKDIHAVTKEG